MTTNGTLLKPTDITLLRAHPFAVTVSLDSGAETHDRQRPRHGGLGGSWKVAIGCVGPLLAAPGRAKVAARATVTRTNLDIATALETLTGLGFPEAGFAPLRVGLTGSGALREGTGRTTSRR